NDLACRVLQPDNGLDRAALVPPEQHDGADHEQRPDDQPREGIGKARAEALMRRLGEMVRHDQPPTSMTRRETMRVSCDTSMRGARPQSEDGNRSLALDLDLAERLAFEGRRDLLPYLLGGGHASRRAHAHHARGDIDRVAPDVELIALLADHARDH